jgi:DNA invertase Pin-like site-specific DNA recombinase
MLIGYARVSTAEQTLALQQDGLTKAGCERLFTDTVSGSQTERPGLDEALDFLRPGDTLVVWRLDRLGRSLRHLIPLCQTAVRHEDHVNLCASRARWDL